jgi:hypothetical protein
MEVWSIRFDDLRFNVLTHCAPVQTYDCHRVDFVRHSGVTQIQDVQRITKRAPLTSRNVLTFIQVACKNPVNLPVFNFQPSIPDNGGARTSVGDC